MFNCKPKTANYKFTYVLLHLSSIFTAMKKCIWVLLLLLAFSVKADVLDSLLQVAVETKDPILKSDAYLVYLNKLARLDRDSAMAMMQQYEDSCGTRFDYGRYRSQSLRAYYLCFESKYEESLRLLHEALAKQKAIKDESGIAQTINRLGLTNNYFGRFEQALSYLKLARAAFIKLQDSTRLDMVLNNLGAIHAGKLREQMAIQYYRQSLAIRLHKKDYYWVGYSYYNIGQAYLTMEQLDSARYYNELALHTFKTQTASGEAPPMVHLGMGAVYLQINKLSEAYSETQKGLAGGEAIGQTELVLEGKLLLSKILFAQRKFKEAYEIQDAYLELKSTVDSSNNATIVAEIEAKYKNTEQALQIEQLSTQKLDAENKAQQLRLYMVEVAGILIVIAALMGLVWLRRNQREKMERSLLNTRIAEVKMFALRAQMNPHFIFNCINTAQHFVMHNQQQQAYEYLANFAKLLRSVMENSAKTFVPFDDELQQVKLYLELEAIRFNHKFTYTIKLDSALGNGVYEVPGMLIQPIVENAIGHGLLNRNDDQGELLLQFSLTAETIICEITDNGVGREQAAAIKQSKNIHYQSAAIPNILERLEVLRKETGVSVSMTIMDLKEGERASGTKVVLVIPHQ
jgi:tetratricopeptide (TPR) repeat protein